MNIQEFTEKYIVKALPLRLKLTRALILKLAYKKYAKKSFSALTEKEQLSVLIYGINRIIMSLEHIKTIFESMRKQHR